MAGFWISLAVLLAALAGGLAFAVVRGLQLYRRLKRTNAAFGARIERITASVASIEGHLAAAEASGSPRTTAGSSVTSWRKSAVRGACDPLRHRAARRDH